MSLNILAIAASTREGSLNRTLVLNATRIAKGEGHVVNQIDYRTLLAPLFDARMIESAAAIPEAAQNFIEAVQQADAMILAVPEFNWSVPGHFKNLIDWMSCVRPYPIAGKPVLLLAASPSRRGGILGLSHLQTILAALGAHVWPQHYALGEAALAFDAEGTFTNPALGNELELLVQQFLNK